MRVRVLYFGVLKDVFGGEGETVELADGANVGDLLRVCGGRWTGSAGLWDSIAVAVNQEYARADGVLREGDVVAFLPPVSGGAGRWEF
jgi:molybdopterin converting factor subunit 1